MTTDSIKFKNKVELQLNKLRKEEFPDARNLQSLLIRHFLSHRKSYLKLLPWFIEAFEGFEDVLLWKFGVAGEWVRFGRKVFPVGLVEIGPIHDRVELRNFSTERVASLKLRHGFHIENDDPLFATPWQKLRSLYLIKNLKENCCDKVISSPALSNLKFLSLNSDATSPEVWMSLCSSPYLGNVTSLNFFKTPDIGSVIGPLARNSLTFDNLERLAITGGGLGSHGIKSMLSNLRHPLKRLTISSDQMTSEALSMLANSDMLMDLERLKLNRCHVTNEGLDILAQSDMIRGLEYLALENNRISDWLPLRNVRQELKGLQLSVSGNPAKMFIPKP